MVRIQAIARGNAVRRRMNTQLQHLNNPTQVVQTKNVLHVNNDQSLSIINEKGERSKV